MNAVTIILVVAAVAALIYFVFVDKSKGEKTADKNWENNSPFDYPLPDFPGNYTTPKGAIVVTEQTLPDNNRDVVLRSIDMGIDDYLRSTAQLNYQEYQKHPNFTVAMLTRTVPAADTGEPTLKIKMPQAWKGTEFDTGTGYIKAAGLVLGLDDRLMAQPVIFIGYNTTYLDFLAEIVRFKSRS